jgi:hypothetical protein
MILALVVGVRYLYNQKRGIQELQEEVGKRDHEVAERDRQIGILETQLAPFRAIALDRFPGAKEGEAIARLATQIQDLQRQFDAAQSVIRSFAVEITIEMRGNWKDGKMPDPSGLIKLTGGTAGSVKVSLSSGEEKEIVLPDLTEIHTRDLGNGGAELYYVATASPANWILGHRSDELEECRAVEAFLFGVNPNSTTDSHVTIVSIKVRLLINGVGCLGCALGPAEGQGIIDLNKFPGMTAVTWRGKATFTRI